MAEKQLEEYSDSFISIRADISEPNTAELLFHKTQEKFGKVDIWINNAGVSNLYIDTIKQEYNSIKTIVDINITSLIHSSIVVADLMEKQGFGKIFNLEGLGSDGRTIDKMALYGTTKSAVAYFSKSFAKELKGSKVQLGTISPGMVITDLVVDNAKAGNPEERKQMLKIFNILGETTETASKFLAPRILNSNRNYDRIKFLTGRKVMARFFGSLFQTRTVLTTEMLEPKE